MVLHSGADTRKGDNWDERALQSYLLKQLRKNGIFAFKVGSASVRGVADVCVIHNGVYFIEVKSPKGGKVSVHQLSFMEVCEQNKVFCTICKSKGDVNKIIEFIKSQKK